MPGTGMKIKYILFIISHNIAEKGIDRQLQKYENRAKMEACGEGEAFGDLDKTSRQSGLRGRSGVWCP